ncbi:MAG: DEAD/DEAH box helicase [Verrucomicrobiales bacterium]
MNAEKAALSYLHTFPAEVQQEGGELRRAGAVKDIFGSYQAFQTRLRIGSQLYQCSFHLNEEGRWAGALNGRTETQAPLVASMLEFLDRGGDLPAASTDPDEKTLDEMVEAQIGRRLQPKEQDYLAKIEGRYSRWREKGEIIDHDLVRLHPRWQVESYESLSLWPENQPPEDMFEFWNYVAYALAKKNLTWPPFLNALTDLESTRQKFHVWEREGELDLWRQRTAQLSYEDTVVARQAKELRLQLTPREARPQARDLGETRFQALDFATLGAAYEEGRVAFDAASELLWAQLREHWKMAESQDLKFEHENNRKFLARLFMQPALADRLVTLDEHPFERSIDPLRWLCTRREDGYVMQLNTAQGEPITHSLIVLPARPPLYLSDDVVFPGPLAWEQGHEIDPRHELPAQVVECSQGVDFLLRLGVELPPELAARVIGAPLTACVSLKLSERKFAGDTEYLLATVRAADEGGQRAEALRGEEWHVEKEAPAGQDRIVRYDRTVLRHFPGFLAPLGLAWDSVNRRFRVKLTKAFPEKFYAWARSLPDSVRTEMDPLLETLMADPLRATVRFDVQPSADESVIDWFDLKIVLNVEGMDLSPEELRALVEARGGFVRMADGAWRRLNMVMPEGQQAAIAELGLDIYDLSGERHRLHVLQLSSPAAREIFEPDTWNRLCDRASALKLSVRPSLPGDLRATLRPYQVEGFHFLSYLATNQFGGILADDMGLGKTVQSLCWLLWLRQNAAGLNGSEVHPVLVVAPKSVLDVWAGECAKFAPALRIQVLRNKDQLDLGRLERGEIDILVLNYAQLRVNHDKLKSRDWLAIILDEGQQVKNPDSMASRAARDLRSNHRLVLTGTPIENRLLDMWSLMAFAMPGVLGNRKYFTERFDRRKDPNAHLRLGARLRPFLLRRTKNQVALDLPSRTEEDVLCKLETEQDELYQAELERIQNILLGFQSDEALRRNSFVVLQGLMRLRQICCHPALIDPKHSEAESTKTTALFYLLDQVRDAGHKILVFSQFTSMLDLIRQRLEAEERPHFLLTGQTQNRHEVVAAFQESADPAVFLLSLKAGGSGLNLTAASYVVLYDPWWNPAVENQAIDRTHRIGQTNPVIAYRLIASNTIEEKIRVLQQQKRDLVTGVLGEESFTKNLNISDVRFLFEREEIPKPA